MEVSVCMATHNGEPYIQRQVDSILVQLGENDELIISDDSSSDETLTLLRSYGDPRIRLFADNTFYNPTLNFANALKEAQGDFIFLADQDDYWHPNKIATQKEYLKNSDLVVCDCRVVDGEGQTIHDSYFDYIKANTGFWTNFLRNRYIGCCMAFKKSLLSHILPIPSEELMHDWWIALVAEVYGEVRLCPEPLMDFIRHGKNFSNSGFKSTRSLSQKLKIRKDLLQAVIQRKYLGY